MSDDVLKYFKLSFRIIFSYPKILVIWLIFWFIYFSEYLKLGKGQILLYFVTMIAFLFIWPIVYGRYIEVMENKIHESYLSIFKKHCLNYYIVSIIISIPAGILIFFLNLFQFGDIQVLKKIIFILINIISIYIIPLVFITQKRLYSIRLGLKCIIGNFKYSWFLVAIVILSSISNDLFERFATLWFGEYSILLVVTGSCFSFIIILVDFSIFITASLILKEKLL